MADTIFINGQVLTVNKHDTITEAVAVEGNKIVAVGRNEEVKQLISENTKVIDLKGKSLLPGFIDSHLHITMYGTNKLAVSCKDPSIGSLDDLIIALKDKAANTPKGQWVRAWGFNNTKIAEGRYPTRYELDQVSTEHPVLVIRACGHISVANSMALEIEGIENDTPDPEGGEIIRDENGVPTGVLVEQAHMNIFETAQFSQEELTKAVEAASRDFVEAGITSIHDAGGYGPDNLRVLQQAVKSGGVKTRIYAMICSLNQSEEFIRKAIDSGITTGLGDEKFRIGPAKVFIDGSSSGPTVATRQPYTSDEENYGILYYTQEELNQILGEAHEKGFQITAHAQGDRAIEMLLNCIEKALEKNPRQDHRHRIEHSGITMPDLVTRIKKLGVVPIPNPPFFYEYGDGYIKNYGERVNHMYPVKDFIESGIIAAGASDNPVAHYNPLLGIHVAVNRKSQTEQVVGIGQKVDILEAIRLYTWNGAYASFEEKFKGSIEIGKLADLVVLDCPITEVDVEKIKDIKVEMTIIDGEIVYESEAVHI